MPQIKSAFKSLKQSKKRHEANKAAMSEIRTLAKKIQEIITEKDKDGAEPLLRLYESKLCKAAKTKLIKKENASRKIARIRKAVNKIVK
ncbi:MAG: 30S ribosomal protein S20 [Candidatus Omnitrophica bacterium]|nr:30S ribosomal protein S20 [Candidatus Omnitrophota bacterium]